MTVRSNNDVYVNWHFYSGSPLVCKNNAGGFTLVGVASWAALSCSEETPTGFAKGISQLLDHAVL